MRLDKFLCETVGLSRKDAKTALSKSLVTINGMLCKSADRKITDTDVVALNGKELTKRKEFLYLMLHKPAGVVSATEDARERTVLDLVQKSDCATDEIRNRKLFPVGRLDKDTEGLLLITDDGALAHRLMSPRHHVDKKYLTRVAGRVPKDAVKRFSEGIMVGQDYRALPAGLEILSYEETEDVSELLITLREGKFHQVKRMCHELGCEVLSLKRLSMGSLTLDETLAPGEFRELTEEEVKSLQPPS